MMVAKFESDLACCPDSCCPIWVGMMLEKHAHHVFMSFLHCENESCVVELGNEIYLGPILLDEHLCCCHLIRSRRLAQCCPPFECLVVDACACCFRLHHDCSDDLEVASLCCTFQCCPTCTCLLVQFRTSKSQYGGRPGFVENGRTGKRCHPPRGDMIHLCTIFYQCHDRCSILCDNCHLQRRLTKLSLTLRIRSS